MWTARNARPGNVNAREEPAFKLVLLQSASVGIHLDLVLDRKSDRQGPLRTVTVTYGTGTPPLANRNPQDFFHRGKDTSPTWVRQFSNDYRTKRELQDQYRCHFVGVVAGEEGMQTAQR